MTVSRPTPRFSTFSFFPRYGFFFFFFLSDVHRGHDIHCPMTVAPPPLLQHHLLLPRERRDQKNLPENANTIDLEFTKGTRPITTLSFELMEA